MRILILTCKFGMGHFSASQSLSQQLSAAFPDARVEVEDFCAYALPTASEAVYKTFQLLVTHGPGLYNACYKLTENSRPGGLPLPLRPLSEPMAELIAARRPDAVFATHPFCAQLVSHWKETTGSALPLITCVTDVTAHAEWLCPGSDRYLVAAPVLRDELVAKGVPADRILVTGIPVKAEFKRPPRRSEKGPRELLIMGGGLGLVPRPGPFYEGLNSLPGVHTTLIAGHNPKLYDQLHGRYDHITVLGYTDQVYDFMASAHLLLSKPGGITTFEAIASHLPILAWEPFLEQERRNARFLLRCGVGRVAPQEPHRCLAQIRSLIYDKPALAAMSRRCAALQSQLAAREVEDLLVAANG